MAEGREQPSKTVVILAPEDSEDHVGEHVAQHADDSKPKATKETHEQEQENPMANPRYLLQYLVRKTHFDVDEVRTLQIMYRAFTSAKAFGEEEITEIDRTRMRELIASLFGITSNIMLDRIFDAFDGDGEGTIGEDEFIIGLSALLRGSLDQQISYVYDVYDINGDGGIGREEIWSCLKGCLHVIPGVLEADEMEESLNELTDIVMKKFDITNDGNITVGEFRHVIRRDPTLLEILGEALPLEQTAVPFVALLNSKPRNFSNFLSRPKDASWAQERERYTDFVENVQNEDFVDEVETGRGFTVAGKDVKGASKATSFVTSYVPSSMLTRSASKTNRVNKVTNRLYVAPPRQVETKTKYVPHKKGASKQNIFLVPKIYLDRKRLTMA